jgi:hypothetical protein
MIKNFRYEEEGRVALSGVPETPESVDWLYEQGVRTVVSLHPVSESVQARLAERGMAWEPFLISDFAQPMPGSLRALFERMQARVSEEPAVLLH